MRRDVDKYKAGGLIPNRILTRSYQDPVLRKEIGIIFDYVSH